MDMVNNQVQTGKVLLAEPFMMDPNFKRSTVLLCEHNAEGSVGFIMNKPLDMRVDELIEDFPEFDAKVFFGGPVQTEPIVEFDGSTSDSEITWEASLGYRFTEDQLYYFKAATGFRQGGINANATTAAQLGITIPDSFGADTVLNLEA